MPRTNKKISQQGLADKLSEDITRLIGNEISEQSFVDDYGQAIHDVVMDNFGNSIRNLLIKHVGYISEENEELMKEFKPIRASLSLFCSAFV